MGNCHNSNCHNHDDNNEFFCEDCLLKAMLKMDLDDLYEIFLEGDARAKDTLREGDIHGLMSPEEIRATRKLRKKWFKTINKYMLTKFKD